MASPGKRHYASCIGTLSFPTHSMRIFVGRWCITKMMSYVEWAVMPHNDCRTNEYIRSEWPDWEIVLYTGWQSDVELGHILWPSDPGIQRPGDPVDLVTLFYNELLMSIYVADKRLQWSRGLPVFYRWLAFARFWKVKFWRSFIKCQYSMTVGRIFTKMYIFRPILGFFRKPENSGLTPGQNDDPVTRTWKMTQMTQWPNDPVPCLLTVT